MARRHFLAAGTAAQAALLGAATGCASTPSTTESTSTASVSGAEQQTFQHGVASGDPLADAVILWTRVSPSSTDLNQVTVGWWIGPQEDGSDPTASGNVQARSEHDYTVKIDARKLTPDTRYFYGFNAEGARSRTGKTRTLPSTNVEQIRFAVTSCANYPIGYFNAYRHIADTPDLNAVLSLGDYLYEYANKEYGDGTPLNRVPEPAHEILTLADYRLRHAQHKAETDLQDAHAAHPWIVTWDDHESANNSWTDGAENHSPEEGDWSTRKAAAIKAYYEWMPVRELPSGLFRQFRFGALAELIMLDTRLAGRDEQGERDDLEHASDPDRTLLGEVQEGRFFQALSSAQNDQVQWKLIGQQVVFAPWSDATSVINPDSWDGYRESRRRVLQHVTDNAVDNMVILTGDVHSSWGMEVPGLAEGSRAAIELVTPAVSSPPLGSVSESAAELVERAQREQPHITYAEGLQNGYLVVDLTRAEATARWLYTGPSNQRSATATTGKTLTCASGSNSLQG